MASKSKAPTAKGTLGAPIRGLLAGIFVMMISGSASASLNPALKQRVLRQADAVNRLAQSRVDTLNNLEGRQLADLLDQASRILRGQGSGPNPGPYPGPNPGPYPGPYPNPNPGPYPPHSPINAYTVTARLGNVDVSFDGYGLEALNQQCTTYFSGQSKVYSIQVNGKTVSDNWNGFSTRSACAILTLNAQPLSSFTGAELNAKVGQIPLSIKVGSGFELQSAIEKFIPKVTGNGKVYSFVVNGKTYSDNWNGFTTKALVAILKGNAQDGFGYLISQGTLGNVPFVFTGNIGREIETQCLDYFRDVFGTGKIYSFVVNGKSRSDNWNGFTAAQTCMTVKTLAKQNR